jgi:hypothetical protein
MSTRPRHPNKHIELSIRYAESLGWRVELSQGHDWGHLLCPLRTRDGCILSFIPRRATQRGTPVGCSARSTTVPTDINCMEHEFTLILTGIEELTPEIVNALYESGCDDGLIGRQFGQGHITFSREAPTLQVAILSAIRDVRRAGVGVLRVDECNLVTPSEIARKIKRTRECVRQYIAGQRGPGGFPPPVCHITEGKPLWMWCEVAAWLHENNIIDEEDLRDAQHVATINSVLEAHHQRHLDPQLTEEVLSLLNDPAR